MTPRYVRRTEAASMLGISARQLDRLVGRGLIVGHVQPDKCDPLFEVATLAILPETKQDRTRLEPVCIERKERVA